MQKPFENLLKALWCLIQIPFGTPWKSQDKCIYCGAKLSYLYYLCTGDLIVLRKPLDFQWWFIDHSNLTPYFSWIYFKKYKNIFAFSIFSSNWGTVDSWNLSSWNMRIYGSYVINVMAADDLATQGARSSAAMAFTYFSHNILGSSMYQKGLLTMAMFDWCPPLLTVYWWLKVMHGNQYIGFVATAMDVVHHMMWIKELYLCIVIGEFSFLAAVHHKYTTANKLELRTCVSEAAIWGMD